MAGSNLTVKVVSPESTVFSGEASALIAPAWDGRVGILPGHAPMITLLGAGPLEITAVEGAQSYEVAGGLIKVEGNHVTVLTEYASDTPAPPELVRELLGTGAGQAPATVTDDSPSASA